jgi:hypothetical protein
VSGPTPKAATICAIELIVSRLTRELYQIAINVTMPIFWWNAISERVYKSSSESSIHLDRI